MRRRDFLQQTAWAASTLAAANPPSLEARAAGISNEAASQPRRPNILWIMTDQQRFDCLGANGNALIQTPNLDRLAARSANFSNAFVQSPVCTPSRACYFSGRYAHSHRNRVNYTELDEREVLMPARLQTAGYQTTLIGKTHLYYRYPPTNEEAQRTGFDTVELHDGVNTTDPWSDYTRWRNQHDPRRDVYYRALAKDVDSNGEPPPGQNPFRAAIDAEFTDTAWTGARTRHHLEQLAREEKPFFLFSSFWKPHSPHEVPTPYDAMYNDVEIPLPKIETLDDIHCLPTPVQKLILRGKNPPYDTDRERLQWIYRSYYADVSHIDREVGLILDTLEATGQADNTIVVFNSDHGDQLLEHGLFGKNVFFEASVRVPFMIALPGAFRSGNHDTLVESVDVLPTLFDLIGLPEPYENQSRSLAPLLTDVGRSYKEREVVFCENVIPEVFGRNRVIFEKGKGVGGIRHADAKMVRSNRWKYNYYPEGYEELYDLRNDPNEQQNRAGDSSCKAVVSEMKSCLLDWLINSVETDQIAPTWLI